MILIIKKINATTRVAQIEEFLAPALKGGLLKRKGVLERLEIKMFRHPDLASPEYHAIIKIEPDAVARRVIQRLNRKICDGKPVNICEYHVRYRTNDRREVMQSTRNDRRVIDRRRKNIDITDVTSLKLNNARGNALLAESVKLAQNPFDNGFKI